MGREGGLPRMLQTTDFFRIVPTILGARNSFFYNICPFILAQTYFGDPQRSREYCFYPDDLCYSVISRKFLYSRNFETITPERQLEIKESLCNLYTYPHMDTSFVQYFYASCCLRKFVQFLIKSIFRAQIPYEVSFHAEGSTVQPRYNEPRSNKMLVTANTIHKRKRKIYLDITNNCQLVIKDEC